MSSYTNTTCYAPAIQTCEVWKIYSQEKECGHVKDRQFLRLDQRPVPLVPFSSSQTTSSPYINNNSVYHIYYATTNLDDLSEPNIRSKTIKLYVWSNRIEEYHPDGILVIWWNPYSILSYLFKEKKPMCGYYRMFSSGAIEYRIEGYVYTWSEPVARTVSHDYMYINTYTSDTVNNTLNTSFVKEYKCQCRTCILNGFLHLDDSSVCHEFTDEKNSIVECINCGDNMLQKDVNKYRVGYWCSRICAYSTCNSDGC